MVKQTLVHKSSRIKVYNTLAVPILLYGSKIWTLRTRDKTSGEMKFFGRTGRSTLSDHKKE
jgi:hypothetical protein